MGLYNKPRAGEAETNKFLAIAGRAIKAEFPPTKRWVHLAVTTSGKEMKLYYDGELIASKEVSHPPIAGAGDAIGDNLSGALDDVRVYSSALSQDEIKTVMLGGHADAPYPNSLNIEVDNKYLAWAPGSSVSEQRLFIAGNEDALKKASPTKVLGAEVDTYLFNGMKPNSKYYWRVDTTLPDGTILPSPTWSFSTGSEVEVGEDPRTALANEIRRKAEEAAAAAAARRKNPRRRRRRRRR